MKENKRKNIEIIKRSNLTGFKVEPIRNHQTRFEEHMFELSASIF